MLIMDMGRSSELHTLQGLPVVCSIMFCHYHCMLSVLFFFSRPGTEEGRKTVVSDTNASTGAGLISLDNIRQTSPCVVSTGGKQEIDFEQWNEQSECRN